MDKKSEKILKAIINATDGQRSTTTEYLEKHESFSHIDLLNAIDYLCSLGYLSVLGRGAFISFNESPEKTAAKNKFLAGKTIHLTPSGLHYFDNKRAQTKRWFLETWIAPFMTGFLSGVLVTLAGTALVMLLLHQ